MSMINVVGLSDLEIVRLLLTTDLTVAEIKAQTRRSEAAILAMYRHHSTPDQRNAARVRKSRSKQGLGAYVTVEQIPSLEEMETIKRQIIAEKQRQGDNVQMNGPRLVRNPLRVSNY